MASREVMNTLVMGLLLFSVISVPSVAVQVESPCNNVKTNTIVESSDVSNRHIEYHFQFSEKTNRFCVEVENKGSVSLHSSFAATVDGRVAEPEMPKLEPGESMFITQNVTEYLNVVSDNHTVKLGAYEKTYQYNFTQQLDATSPNTPSPYIKNVSVIRHEKNDTTTLRVDTYNPAKRGYAMYVQVETFGTDGEYTVAAPQPNQSDTISIPLQESSDEVVAGKVRIFSDWAESDGKFDQKEFMSRPGEDTNAWDDNFEQVPGTVDEYTYSNESAAQYREGYVDEDVLSPTEKRAGAVLSVLVLIGSVFWWRR